MWVVAATCLVSWTCCALAADDSAMPAVKDLPVRTAMPDPLVDDHGQKIGTPQQWNRRREEMKRILEYYALGHGPPPPANLVGHELKTRQLDGGKVNYRLVHLAFGPAESLGFDIAIFIPAPTEIAKPPFATIIQPSFFPTPGGPPIKAPPPSSAAASSKAASKKGGVPWPTTVTPEDAAKEYAEPLRRGYAVVTFYYQQCGADTPDYRQSGFFPAYPGYDWGDLAAWAWGMSRCVDYLETQPFADKSKLIALGHSRLGKTALVAGAFDERFALKPHAPAGSRAAAAPAPIASTARSAAAKRGWKRLRRITRSGSVRTSASSPGRWKNCRSTSTG